MLITEVKTQKKNTNRVSVYIDGKFAFGMTQVDALYYHIKEGEEISNERYKQIVEELIYAKARDKAIKLLGYSAKTEKELLQKLEEEYNSEICNTVVEMLKKYGYINDDAYANAYINDSFRFKGWGSNRIKFELKKKGVDENKIAEAMENADLNEEEKACEILKKRLKGCTTPDYKERAKHTRYLASRGFDYEVIKTAFLRLTQDNFDDWS